MASPALTRVGEARLAGAIARLLRWEARLLARPTHDPASRSAALRGLEWAADFARALDAESCAEWLDALRDRASERPGHTPLVWSALGADACADVAAQLESHHTLVPLAPGARGWRAMAAAVRDYEEPVEGAPAAAEPATAEPAAEPGPTAIDLSTAPFRFGDRGRVPVGTRVAGEPALVREFALALADWVGPYGIHVDARNGRVELSGARPSDHAEPGRLSDSALEALRLLHLAAGRIAAPLLVADPAEGAVSWSVRLPAAEGARHLFVEAGAQRLALPWHAVVTYGLADSGRPHVVLGRGLERIALGLDWLHGLGPGKPVDAPPIEAIAFDSPALLALPQVLEADDGGRFVAVEVLPVLPAAPETEAEPAPEAPAELAPAPEVAVEEPAPPADNPERSEPPPAALVALVADDSFTARVFLRRMLAMRGITVDEAEDGHETRARLAGRRYDLVFLDADMPGGGALALAPSIAADVLDVAVVLVRDDGERAAAQAAGFAYALYKPFAEDEVAAALRALAEESRPGA